jgi:hypothetical protein
MNPSEFIDKYIAGFIDWRGQMLFNLRQIIHEADHENAKYSTPRSTKVL